MAKPDKKPRTAKSPNDATAGLKKRLKSEETKPPFQPNTVDKAVSNYGR